MQGQRQSIDGVIESSALIQKSENDRIAIVERQ
jgi:hypothetical protein